jgi:CBS domain containing-hemolysin-like protein
VLMQSNGAPRIGEQVLYGEAELTVVETAGRRVRKVRVGYRQDEPAAS